MWMGKSAAQFLFCEIVHNSVRYDSVTFQPLMPVSAVCFSFVNLVNCGESVSTAHFLYHQYVVSVVISFSRQHSLAYSSFQLYLYLSVCVCLMSDYMCALSLTLQLINAYRNSICSLLTIQTYAQICAIAIRLHTHSNNQTKQNATQHNKSPKIL